MLNILKLYAFLFKKAAVYHPIMDAPLAANGFDKAMLIKNIRLAIAPFDNLISIGFHNLHHLTGVHHRVTFFLICFLSLWTLSVYHKNEIKSSIISRC